MNGCIYRTKDGECDLYEEGGKYKAFCDMDGCEGRKMTNADRFRAMTDEELAEWMANKVDCQYCSVRSEWCTESEASCRTNWLDWLKQEAKE